MTESSARIHNKYQFEIITNYLTDEQHKENSFDSTFYLFLPQNMDINSYSYQKSEFYKDSQYYVRLKTPVYPLKVLATKNSKPFENIKKSVQPMLVNPTEKNRKELEDRLKLFCCILKSALRDHVNLIRQKIYKEDLDTLVKDYIKNVEDIEKNFRSLQAQFNVPSIAEKSFSAYLLADEYISLLIEYYSHKLFDVIKDKDLSKDKKVQKEIIKLIKNELDHRQERQFLSVIHSDQDKEAFLYRRSVLKKYTESALYLRKSKKREGAITEQVGFGVAAGMATMFATLVAFLANSYNSELTTTTIILIIIIYIFKDRTKDLLKSYFSNSISGRFFDYKTSILSEKAQSVGFLRDKMRFVNENNVPDDILTARNKSDFSKIENNWLGEVVLMYTNNIKLNKKELKSIYPQEFMPGLSSILRFKINSFVYKTDSPEEEIHVLNEEGVPAKIKSERVYHMHLIIKSDDAQKKLIHYRIVCNRKGIKRMEEL